MPKTAMHKNHFAKSWKNQVWFAGQIFAMKTKTKAHAMNEAANRHLRSSISCLHCPHDAAA
jgi:hypothetical protein